MKYNFINDDNNHWQNVIYNQMKLQENIVELHNRVAILLEKFVGYENDEDIILDYEFIKPENTNLFNYLMYSANDMNDIINKIHHKIDNISYGIPIEDQSNAIAAEEVEPEPIPVSEEAEHNYTIKDVVAPRTSHKR